MKLALICLSLTGCAAAAPAIVPAINLGVCIAVNALDGDSVAQIATACGTDAETVIVAIASESDPKMAATPAYKEAKSKDAGGQ